MKIALCFSGCHRRGGVERVLMECARFLVSRGHDVHLFARDYDPEPDCPLQFHPIEASHSSGFIGHLSFYRNCLKAMRGRGQEFDVINTHGCVCPFGTVQNVHSVHRVWLEHSRAFRHPLSLSRWKQRLNPLHPLLLHLERKQFTATSPRRIIALTQQVKEGLNRLYGVPPERVVVNPNGFNPEEFNPDRRAQRREEMRRKLKLEPRHVALVFVANELPRKGYATILGAMRILQNPNVRLLVVGKPDQQAVMSEAEAFGVASQVLACGLTSDVAGYHAAADLFVLPTQYEAYCLAILEALGSGLPVITSDIPGARDPIQPGVNGTIIRDPRSAAQLADVLRPLLDEGARAALAANASASVESYRWPKVLARYEQILQESCTSPALAHA